MAHDGHLVQRRLHGKGRVVMPWKQSGRITSPMTHLAVEQHSVVVHEVPLDHPPLSQDDWAGALIAIAQVNAEIALADDTFSAGVLVGSTVDQLLQKHENTSTTSQ